MHKKKIAHDYEKNNQQHNIRKRNWERGGGPGASSNARLQKETTGDKKQEEGTVQKRACKGSQKSGMPFGSRNSGKFNFFNITAGGRWKSQR